MMNRVFDANAAIDLEPLSPDPEGPLTATTPRHPLPPSVQPSAAPPPANAARPRPNTPPASLKPPRGPSELTLVLVALLGGAGLAAALGSVLLVQQWAGLQRNLSQERNLLLVERLRTLGPATAAATATPEALATPPAPMLDPRPASLSPAPAGGNGGAPSGGTAGAAGRSVSSFDGLPPPPPEEPWMKQLADLPPSGGRLAPLRVPVSARLSAPAPAAPRKSPAVSRASVSQAPLPQLVGLVGAPGRAGSAIFQVGGSAMNVNVGEQIGGSGWLLRAADAESAVIERGAEVRRIAIVSGG